MSKIAAVKKDMIILEKSEFSALRAENEVKLQSPYSHLPDVTLGHNKLAEGHPGGFAPRVQGPVRWRLEHTRFPCSSPQGPLAAAPAEEDATVDEVCLGVELPVDEIAQGIFSIT